MYQQTRKVRGREYGPYWLCRSGWGKVTHLGIKLPYPIERAFTTLDEANALLEQLDQTMRLLRRFCRGDALTDPERERLASLGFSLDETVIEVTQRADVVSSCELGEAQHLRQRLDEMTTDPKEREALISLGLICATAVCQRSTKEAA